MSRPSVVVFEPDRERRKLFADGIAELGYEVVPCADEAAALLYVETLGPGVLVAPAGIAGFCDSPLLARFLAAPAPWRRTLLLLGLREEERAMPEEAVFVPEVGLPAEELLRRVVLLLVGREVGIEPDFHRAALVGDLALVPMLELLRSLHRLRLSGRLALKEGEIRLERGEIAAASAGQTTGEKAFFRLARREAGPFRLRLEPAAGRREIRAELSSLILAALDEQTSEAPPRQSRLRLEVGPALFAARLSDRDRALLAAIPAAGTVQGLLDALPDPDGEILADVARLLEGGLVALEEALPKVAVVTDSTCDLPADLARAHGIRVVPLLVLFGDKVYHDGVDLKVRDFYDLLTRGKVHPRTSPPLKADFVEAYRTPIRHQDVLSLHLSGKLSETVTQARAAAGEGLVQFRLARGKGEPAPAISVVDTGHVSLGLGVLALFAARMAQRGLDLPAIAARLDELRRRLPVFFVVDTFEFLVRGGRIGRARAFVGTLLKVKPILGVVDGEVAPVDRVRGEAALPRLVELLAGRVDPARPVVVAIAHAQAPAAADRLLGLLGKRLQIAESFVAEMGPTVGTHAGPGTLGAALFQPTDDEWALLGPL